jgi:alpha-glucosidase
MRTAVATTLAVALLTLISCASPPAAELSASYGDGAVQFSLLEGAPLRYAVRAGGKTVIEPSPLRFSVDDVELTDGAEITQVARDEGNETYPTRGVHAQAHNSYKQVAYALKHAKSGTSFVMEVRTFPDGVAYRFIAPGDASKQRVPDERSIFTLPAGSTLWYHGMRGHYEGDYVQRDVSEVPAGEWAAPPLTVKLPNDAGYASISESNLVNYSGFALEADGTRGFAIGLGHRQPVSYPYELRYSKEDVARLSQPAKIDGTITTPWRVVIVAPDLNKLVNSDIISNLAPPPDPKLFPKGVATDWVKPGRAVWQYLDRPQSPGPADPLATAPATRRAAAPATAPATTRRRGTPPEQMKTFSRLAGELGFEYNVLEGFWNRWTDDEIRDVVEYSRQQGVGLFVWVHSNRLFDPANRAALFKRLRDTGVVGLKVDFFDHEHKEVIDLYHALLREGAQNKILFDFHGANKPAGESRTWPNELVREAVRGMEASRMKERARHNATLPFTRHVVGHAEYTPVHFGDRRGDTTWAHQIATAAVFTAPLLTYGAHPQKMLDHPARDMIKSIPSTWDETRVLPPSSIGEVAVMARRKGDTWFLAVINGPEARSFDVPLSFLGEGKRRALLVRDHESQDTAVQVQRDAPAGSSDTMKLQLRPGGGFIARFDKE